MSRAVSFFQRARPEHQNVYAPVPLAIVPQRLCGRTRSMAGFPWLPPGQLAFF